MTTPYATIPFDPTAVMGKRVVAAIIDVFIAVAITFVLFASLARTSSDFIGTADEFCNLFNETQTDAYCLPSTNDVFVIDEADLLWVGAAPLIYFLINMVVLAGATGASIGKHIMGLRVVKQSDGTLHGFGAAALRWVLWIVDGLPWVFFFIPLVALVTSLASKGHRRVGDMAASTLVVHKSQVGVPPAVVGLTVMPGGVGMQATAPIAQPSAMPAQPPYSPPGSTIGTPSPPRPAGYVAPTAPGETPGTGDIAPPAAPPTESIFGDPPDPPVSEPEPVEPAAPGVEEPTWDNQRNTYIQWDPTLNEWMEWSASAQHWIPISQ